jgi:hypothetical protein
MFRRNLMPPSSGDNRGSKILWSVSKLSEYTTKQSRGQPPSCSLPWKPDISRLCNSLWTVWTVLSLLMSEVFLPWLQLENRQMSSLQPLAVLRGHRPLLQRYVGLYSHMLHNHGFSVRVEDTTMPNISKAGNENVHSHDVNSLNVWKLL